MGKFFFFLFLLLSAQRAFGQSNIDSLRKYVVKLSTAPYARNFKHIDYLNKSAEYIKAHFSNYSQRSLFQVFTAKRASFKNVLCSFGPDTVGRIIIGANYDVFGEMQGADNNASGVAGLFELARLLSKVNKQLLVRIDLVAYTLEDSPSFDDKDRGSMAHARSMKNEEASILGMINLKGIGYFSDRKKTQTFPFFYMKWLYGRRGNFIGIVQQTANGVWARQIRSLMKQYIKGLRVINFKPAVPLPFLSEGAHSTYWQSGYQAICITTMGPWRNKNYHYETDTYETLDYFRMVKVVDMIYNALLRYRP